MGLDFAQAVALLLAILPHIHERSLLDRATVAARAYLLEPCRAALLAAVSKGIPLNLTQSWFGHAQISTTAAYADAVGEEEKSVASRMW